MDKTERQFADIYNDYYPLVVSTLYSKTGNVEDARDIAQEIFISAYKQMDKIDNTRKWLYGAMRYKLIDYFKKNSDYDIDVEHVLYDAGLTFVNGFKETRIVLQEAFDSVENYKNDKERVLFELIAIKRFTYKEAGEQVGMSRRQVRYVYSKIIDRILKYLEKRGIKNVEDIL